ADGERERLVRGQPDLEQARLAVAAVLQAQQAQLVVDAAVEGDALHEQLGQALQLPVQLLGRLEAAEQGRRDLQVEALLAGEEQAQGGQIDTPVAEAEERAA